MTNISQLQAELGTQLAFHCVPVSVLFVKDGGPKCTRLLYGLSQKLLLLLVCMVPMRTLCRAKNKHTWLGTTHMHDAHTLHWAQVSWMCL